MEEVFGEGVEEGGGAGVDEGGERGRWHFADEVHGGGGVGVGAGEEAGGGGGGAGEGGLGAGVRSSLFGCCCGLWLGEALRRRGDWDCGVKGSGV